MRFNLKSLFIFLFSASIPFVFASFSCAFIQDNSINSPSDKTENQLNTSSILEGKVLGKSKKAKIITVKLINSIDLVHFDENTKGLKYAFKDENVNIEYLTSDIGKTAIGITPKPAILPANIKNIDADELSDLFDDFSNKYILIDARSREKYDVGHIPSAISLPLTTMQSKNGLLNGMGTKGKTIIFYSDGPTCGLCTEAARIASEGGFSDIKVMLQGVQGWEKNGGYLAVSDNMIKESHVVLIDTRAPQDVKAGYIANAANVTLNGFKGEAEYDFPTKKIAPIVLYGDEDIISEAEDILAKWGFSTLRRVDGGLAGWQSRGNELVTGNAPGSEGIAWIPLENKNIISAKEFKKSLKKNSPEITIVDVRTAVESAKGKLKNSLSIPLDELSLRLDEIPKDNTIITHCATGARAEMAAIFLGQHRDNVKFLQAKVNCKGEECRIR